MITTEQLQRIFGRVATSSHTPADADELKGMVTATEPDRVQLGKYNIHVGEGQDIQIGDRIYPGIDAVTIREFLRDFLNAVENEPEPKWPEVRRRYLERLESHFRHWSERYTDLRLTTEIRVATYKGQRLNNPEKGSWWFNSALERTDAKGKRIADRIVILGDPGGGKTTACQQSAWQLAKTGLAVTENDQSEANPRVPIYMEVSSYRKDIPLLAGLATYQRILALLCQEMRRLLTFHSVPLTLESFEAYLKASPFTFFFDGLNEVGTDHRENLVGDLLSFIDTFARHDHQFVLTTRKLDYEYDLAPLFSGHHFQILEILEFDSAGMNEFVMRDLGRITEAERALETLPLNLREPGLELLSQLRKGGYEGEEELVPEIEKLFISVPGLHDGELNALASDVSSAQELIQTLRRPEYNRVLWLAQNPSTLKDIVDVFRADHTIPRSRIRLFERAIKARLNAQAAKLGNPRPRFESEIKYRALQKIAVQMIAPEHGLRLEESRVITVIKEVLEERKLDAAPRDLLDECVFRDGLLLEKAFGTYSFVKQPYQEYFVARELRDRWLECITAKKSPLNDKYLRPILNNRYYFQVVSSMAGLLTTTEVEGLLRRLRKGKATQRLAALCLRNAEELPENTTNEYVAWTKHRILRFSVLPENIVNALAIFLAVVSLALVVTFDRSHVFAPVYRTISWMIAMMPFPSVHYAYFHVFLGLTALLAFVVHALVARSKNEAVSGWDLGLTIVTIGLTGSFIFAAPGANWATLILAVGGCFWLVVLMRSIMAVGASALEGSNILLEENVVNRHLIHYLEVMRDIGPNATSAINEIQYSIANNRYMSERIKDTIERTWAISPRTVLQVINEIHIPERQAEGVKVLETAIRQESMSSDLRERAVGALLQVAKTPSNTEVMLGTVDALGNVGLEQPEYRDPIVTMLRGVLVNTEQEISVRRRSWRCLYDMGLRDIDWPRRRLFDFSPMQFVLIAFAVVGVVLIVLALVQMISRN